MTQQTLTRLRKPEKLTGMADAVQQQLEHASTYEGLPFIERLSLLVEHEQLSREQRKANSAGQAGKAQTQATVQELDYQSARNLERSQVANLAQGERLRQGPEPAHYRPLWLWKNLPGLCAGLPSLSARGIALVTTGCHVCCLS